MKVSVFIPLFADSPSHLHPGFAPEYASLDWQKTKEYVLRAETLGFEAVWVPDHLIMGKDDQILDPLVALTVFATITHEIGLGTVVACSAFRHPAVLAKMFSTIDFISNGRMIAGLGSGFHTREFNAFDFPPVDRERTREVVRILQLLFDTSIPEPIDFSGTFYQLVGAVSKPQPKGPMRVYIAGNTPQTLQIAADHAYGWITSGSSTNSFDRIHLLKKLVNTPENKTGLSDFVWFGPVSLWKNSDRSQERARRGIHGTPSEVLAQIESFQKMGFTHIIAAFPDFPDTSMAELFIKEIFPSL